MGLPGLAQQLLEYAIPNQYRYALCRKLPVSELISPTATAVVLLVVLALPHFLFAYVWLRPRSWHRAFGSKDVDAFAALAAAGKLLQIWTFVMWAWANHADGVCAWSAVTLPQFLNAVLLIALGQALNYATFRALGRSGVYYGTRLGHKGLPWVHSYPFNVVPHPQYVGSVLTIWGTILLLHHMLPLPDALYVAVWWSALYLVTALQERYL